MPRLPVGWVLKVGICMEKRFCWSSPVQVTITGYFSRHSTSLPITSPRLPPILVLTVPLTIPPRPSAFPGCRDGSIRSKGRPRQLSQCRHPQYFQRISCCRDAEVFKSPDGYHRGPLEI